MWFHFGRVIGEYPNLGKIKILKHLSIENEKNLIEPLNKYNNCLFFFCSYWKLGVNLTPINSKRI